jgi:hypothetical protein
MVRAGPTYIETRRQEAGDLIALAAATLAALEGGYDAHAEALAGRLSLRAGELADRLARETEADLGLDHVGAVIDLELRRLRREGEA